jgi:predicted Holliday junction resolvase-like endonuclease
MKKLSIFIIIFSLLTSRIDAQIQRQINPSQAVVSDTLQKNNKKEILNELNLTEDQKSKIKELQRIMKQKRDDINNDQTLTDGQKNGKLKDVRIEQRETLGTILTPDQLEKLTEERKNIRRQNKQAK